MERDDYPEPLMRRFNTTEVVAPESGLCFQRFFKPGRVAALPFPNTASSYPAGWPASDVCLGVDTWVCRWGCKIDGVNAAR